MAFASPTSVLASAARTATSQTPAIFVTDAGDVMSLAVNVSAASGTTPTLDLSLQWSHDGTVWFTPETPDTFAQITTTKQVIKTFVAKAPRYRIVYTIGGTTPSFTFDVTQYVVT